MKKIILITVILCASSFTLAADPKASSIAMDSKNQHMQMHEQMAKAHQQAAECLKSGKSEEECRKDFHEMCKESGAPDKCGSWMMKNKSGKKTK